MQHHIDTHSLFPTIPPQFFLPSYWALLVLEYRALSPDFVLKCDGCLGRCLHEACIGVFAPAATGQSTRTTTEQPTSQPSSNPTTLPTRQLVSEEIGPVGFVVVLLLGVTQLGHVCTPVGRDVMYAVLCRYVDLLKVTIQLFSHSNDI